MSSVIVEWLALAKTSPFWLLDVDLHVISWREFPLFILRISVS
jgi:hypothetical protein